MKTAKPKSITKVEPAKQEVKIEDDSYIKRIKFLEKEFFFKMKKGQEMSTELYNYLMIINVLKKPAYDFCKDNDTFPVNEKLRNHMISFFEPELLKKAVETEQKPTPENPSQSQVSQEKK